MDSGASSSPFISFKSKKILRSSVNKQHSANEALGAAKQLRKSDLKPSVSSETLPERYELLGKLFNSLQVSIRLLGLKGYMPTFPKIRRAVETSTDRRFTYTHLTQLKFILPEAIEIKKTLLFDEQTSCMKPDLHLTLNYSFIQNDETQKSDSRNINMKKLFRSRLVSYYKSNPERDEVPEAELPEPFNQSGRVTSLITMKKPKMGPVHTISTGHLAVASHMPQSFRRLFSKSKQVSDHGYN